MSTTALVLGGGGVTGIAWELGLLTGLARRGLDLTGADIVIGTSAGSVVGAQVTSGLPLDRLYDEQLQPADKEIGAAFGRGTMLRLASQMVLPGSTRAKRRRIGRAALKAHSGSAEQRVEVIRSRIGVGGWPPRDLRVTAVNASTGESVVFDRDSGVDLVEAVAASCAVPLVWPPVPVGGVPHIDGGMRSTTNADLAAGADRVVVVAPLPQAFSRRTSIRAQLDRLGPTVRSAVVSPDKESLAAIGSNVLDPAKRADAARAGLRQAADCYGEIAAAWQEG